MYHFCSRSLVVLLMVYFTAFSSPAITFNKTVVNCGVAIEGKTEKISAVFIVKNSGDSLLKLTNVRPGCGCTVVKYDSLVRPGKTTNITAVVNIVGYHSGPISKTVTVTSNAKNQPTALLTIEATIESPVDLSETNLTLTSANMQTPKTLVITSKKKDLQVLGVAFKPSTNDQSTPGWQQKLPPPKIVYGFFPSNITNPLGAWEYKLDITAPAVDKTTYGTLVITTNHPEKKEVTIQTSILP